MAHHLDAFSRFPIETLLQLPKPTDAHTRSLRDAAKTGAERRLAHLHAAWPPRR